MAIAKEEIGIWASGPREKHIFIIYNMLKEKVL